MDRSYWKASAAANPWRLPPTAEMDGVTDVVGGGPGTHPEVQWLMPPVSVILKYHDKFSMIGKRKLFF